MLEFDLLVLITAGQWRQKPVVFYKVFKCMLSF